MTKSASDAAATLGRLGAAARTRSLTSKQRTRLARKAARARWEKVRQGREKSGQNNA